MTLVVLLGAFLAGVAGYAMGVNDGKQWLREALLLDGWLVLERPRVPVGAGHWIVHRREEMEETRLEARDDSGGET